MASKADYMFNSPITDGFTFSKVRHLMSRRVWVGYTQNRDNSTRYYVTMQWTYSAYRLTWTKTLTKSEYVRLLRKLVNTHDKASRKPFATRQSVRDIKSTAQIDFWRSRKSGR